MTLAQAILLGAVQGITEFLPISSSGHLLLLQYWFGLHDDMMIFDIAVHWGTLCAVLIYFCRDIGKLIADSLLFVLRVPRGDKKDAFIEQHPFSLLAGLIFLSTLVTLFIGVFCMEFFEFLIQSILAVGVTWIIMGVLLVLSNRIKHLERERSLTEMNHRDAFFIGLAQGLALLPAISRAGATILMALKCGIKARDAARYSFLLSIPAILGVGLYKLQEGIAYFQMKPGIYLSGFLAALFVGLLAIRILFGVLERGKYHYFGYYCLAAGLFAILSPYLKS